MSLLRYQVRSLMIVRAFERGALYPVPLDAIHTVSYLADALATSWRLKPLDNAVLKTQWVPRSQPLQTAVDRLTGMGLIRATKVEYVVRDSRHALQAEYAVDLDRAADVFAVLDGDSEWIAENTAIGEISFAVTAMGRERAPRAVLVDASYSDPLLDNNNVLSLSSGIDDEPTRTESAGRSLGAIAKERVGHALTPAELTSLYVRHLYALSGEA